MRKIGVLLVAVICCFSLFAQKSFLGKLTFKAELTGEGAEIARSMMPDSYEYQIGKTGVLFKMNGGIAQSLLGDILLTPDGKTYIINHSKKTYSLLKAIEKEQIPAVKVEPQDEILKLLGYDCKKYKIETQIDGKPVTQYAWINDQYKIDVSPNSSVASAAGGALWIDGVKGIPFKMITSVSGITVVMTAVDMKAQKIPKKTFKLPKDYTEQEFNPMKMMGF